jgi:hypothetical protein
MSIQFGIDVNISTLKFDPVNGRRTCYATLTLGRRKFWVMRWDSERTRDYKHRFAFSRDGLMSWSWGVHNHA